MSGGRRATLEDATSALGRVFGHADFRPGQAEIVRSILAGDDVLAVMPTGAGKSLLYQLPAVIGAGPVVVVSPLISLMRDQVAALRARGIEAGALHSASDAEDAVHVLRMMAERRIRLLYLAPERLVQPATVEALRRMHPRILAVDEAHCVSRWADDFRPDYGAIRATVAELGAPQMIAVTATAGPRTRADIAARLFARPPSEFVRSFARPNIALSFRARRDVASDVRAIVARHAGQSGIVYCASRALTDRLARDLDRAGFPAFPYHAGLDSGTRDSNQDRFLRERGTVMVATIAFGMGIDKPDVRYVCHADLPHTVEAYYQEIGRAGRDGAPAAAVALVDPRLRTAWRTLPNEAAEMVSLARHPGCRWRFLLGTFGEPSAPCGRCDHCAGDWLRWKRLSLTVGNVRAALRARAIRWAEGAVDPTRDEREAEPPVPEPVSPAPERPLFTPPQAQLRRRLAEARTRIARVRRVAPKEIADDAALDALAVLPATLDAGGRARAAAIVAPQKTATPAQDDLLEFLAGTPDNTDRRDVAPRPASRAISPF